MKNGHLRFGKMSFHKTVGNALSSFSLRIDRFTGERVSADVAKAHFLSVVGGDAQVAAASAIVSDQQTFTVEGPEIPVLNVNLGRDAQCYRASIQLSTSKRPLRHLIAVSQEFGAIARSEANGRTLLAESSADFIWASMAQIFGLPAVPEWADWFHNKLNGNLAITPLHGLGFQPVLITGAKSEFLQWLGAGIQKSEIKMPEGNGQAIWPTFSLERLLSIPADISSTESDAAQ